MKAKDLREKTKKELEKRLLKKESELDEISYEIIVGQEQDFSKKKSLRREIARIKSILKESSYKTKKSKN